MELVKPVLVNQEKNLVNNLSTKTAHAETPTLEQMICSKDWNCQTALAIAKAESGMNCKAVNTKNRNKSVDRGLFQINSIHTKKYAGKDIFDCQTNIEIAFQIYKASGFNAWSSYNSKAYTKHLTYK